MASWIMGCRSRNVDVYAEIIKGAILVAAVGLDMAEGNAAKPTAGALGTPQEN